MDQIEWLVSHGQQWLSQSDSGGNYSESELLPWQRDMLRDQMAMRRRAAARFPDASRWLWTPRGLAQSSDWWCAKYKASLFPAVEDVVDGCCGVGVDLIALAQRGETLGIDTDHQLVQLANANLATHGLRPTATVGSIPEDVPDNPRWLHLDPDRRTADGNSHRLTDAADFSPSLAQSLQVARRAVGAMIKLAPGTQLTANLGTTAGLSYDSLADVRCWLGNRGECRQQLLLTGALAEPWKTGFAPAHTAVLCEPHETHQFAGLPRATEEGKRQPFRFVYDCHATLHAAHLQAAWAESVGAQALGTSQGYFTSDEMIRSVWAQAFEVVEVLPWDQRRVRRWLRDQRIGEVEVKKRLVQLDANEQQRRLRGAGEQKITLMITRLANRVRVVAARRIVAER